MRSVWNRCWKTFVEVFAMALIPNIISGICNFPGYNWSDWKLWCVQFVLPALGSAMSAAWNKIENYINSKKEETE